MMNIRTIFLFTILWTATSTHAMGNNRERSEPELPKYSTIIKAAQKGCLESLQYWIEKGANIDEKNYYGDTALMWAAAKGHTKCVQLLLENGVNINEKNYCGYTALITAAAKGHTECVQLLLKKGSNINKKNKDDNTALILAALYGHTKCVQLLLENGANTDEKNYCGYTALMWAAAKDYTECVQLLLDNGANIDKKNDYGNTALIRATKNGHTKCVQLLLNWEKTWKNKKMNDQEKLEYICRFNKIFRSQAEAFLLSLFFKNSKIKVPKPLIRHILLLVWHLNNKNHYLARIWYGNRLEEHIKKIEKNLKEIKNDDIKKLLEDFLEKNR